MAQTVVIDVREECTHCNPPHKTIQKLTDDGAERSYFCYECGTHVYYVKKGGKWTEDRVLTKEDVYRLEDDIRRTETGKRVHLNDEERRKYGLPEEGFVRRTIDAPCKWCHKTGAEVGHSIWQYGFKYEDRGETLWEEDGFCNIRHRYNCSLQE